jgi:hypothetical protein
LLLELASVIHGQGYSVQEAVIRGGPESPITEAHCSHAADLPQPPTNKRVIRFWLKGIHTGAKLVRGLREREQCGQEKGGVGRRRWLKGRRDDR